MPSAQEVGTNVDAPANLKKKPSTSQMIGKLFSRQNNLIHTESQAVGQSELDARSRSNDVRLPGVLSGVVNPCPYIRPLEHKLQPRHEHHGLRRPALKSSDVLPSPITVARNRGEANRMLSGNIMDDDLDAVHEESPDMVPPEEVIMAEEHNTDWNRETSKDSGVGHSKSVDKETREDIEDEYLEQSLHITEEQQINYIAGIKAKDASVVQLWKGYIECYAKGQYNLTNPPKPPPFNSQLRYLPAVYPPTEEKRIEACQKYDIVWPQWSEQSSTHLLRAAMQKFNVEFGSVSVFDSKYEVMKIENGYNRHLVDRDISISAHVLFSNDVMVLLDAREDWRFAGNPLVTNRPRIRFYAGAPMIGSDGEVVGVFAIYTKTPRSLFTAAQRRELAEFAALVMKDLDLQAAKLYDPELRSTPILQRDSVINGDYRVQSIESPVLGVDLRDVDLDLVPSGLRSHKSSIFPQGLSRLHLNRLSRDILATRGELTPPSSAESEEQGEFFGPKPKGFGKNHQQLAIMASPDPTSSEQPLTPGSIVLEVPVARPFSSSDITSLYPHPPNSPNHSIGEGELSHQPIFDLNFENFTVSLDNDACSKSEEVNQEEGEPAGNESNNSVPGNSFQNGSSLDSSLGGVPENPDVDDASTKFATSPGCSNSSKQILEDESAESIAQIDAIPSAKKTSVINLDSTLEKPETLDLTKKKPDPLSKDALKADRSSDSSGISNHSPRVVYNNMTEAAFLCASAAQEIGYDLIYAVEIQPARPNMDDRDLVAADGLRKKILVAFGLKVPLELSSETHIRVLRCRGYERWENKREIYADGEYQSGCLIPIHTAEFSRKQRSSGIILGAFRLPGSKRSPTGDGDAAALEMSRLIKFSEKLRDILIPPPTQSPQTLPTPRRAPRRTPTESLFLSPFPANEALEVNVPTSQNDKPDVNKSHERRSGKDSFGIAYPW